jgi:hypothetical protein
VPFRIGLCRLLYTRTSVTGLEGSFFAMAVSGHQVSFP